DSYTRLPAHKTDGLAGTHLPHIAIATGSADAMECVFYKMGIAQSEFTTRNGDGRIHLYRANGARFPSNATNRCDHPNRADCREWYCQLGELVCKLCHNSCQWKSNPGDASVDASELTTRFNEYDMVVWDCEGGERNRGSTNHTALRNYVNA